MVWTRLGVYQRAGNTSKDAFKKGAKVFDLGAHQSVVAMIFAAEVGAQGKVLAVEANEHNYRVGCENKKINHLEQLEILHGAVAKVAGTVEFSDDLNGTIKNNLTTSQSRSVRAFSIDDLIQKYFLPDLIVLDIEGYEALALEGRRKLYHIRSTGILKYMSLSFSIALVVQSMMF